MFASERKRKIKELLLECREMDINTMCSILSASTSTIRRDLDRLEEEGFLKRTHGGAVLAEEEERQGEVHFAPEFPQEDKNSSVDRIARLASRMVKPGEQIFLGNGKICYQMACHLEKTWAGTIVTNNLNVAMRLKDSSISVILLGGEMVQNEGDLYTEGAATLGEVKEIILNKSFVTFCGVMKEFGYFVESKEQAKLYDLLKENSLEMIAVAEKEAFGRIGRVRYQNMDYFPKVISSIDLPEEYKKDYFHCNVTLFTSVDSI